MGVRSRSDHCPNAAAHRAGGFSHVLELGYSSTMLRIARGQYASNGMRLALTGSVLLRCTLKGLIFGGAAMAVYVRRYRDLHDDAPFPTRR